MRQPQVSSRCYARGTNRQAKENILKNRIITIILATFILSSAAFAEQAQGRGSVGGQGVVSGRGVIRGQGQVSGTGAVVYKKDDGSIGSKRGSGTVQGRGIAVGRGRAKVAGKAWGRGRARGQGRVR